MHLEPHPIYHRDIREPNILKRYGLDRLVRRKHDTDKGRDPYEQRGAFTQGP
jgi:hypothetical protein